MNINRRRAFSPFAFKITIRTCFPIFWIQIVLNLVCYDQLQYTFRKHKFQLHFKISSVLNGSHSTSNGYLIGCLRCFLGDTHSTCLICMVSPAAAGSSPVVRTARSLTRRWLMMINWFIAVLVTRTICYAAADEPLRRSLAHETGETECGQTRIRSRSEESGPFDLLSC